MSKSASDRRFKKRAAELGEMFASNPVSFHRVWSSLSKGWINEVLFRARAQGCDSSTETIPAIFSVLEKARELAASIGAKTDPKVVDSLVLLQHECCKAVARVTNPKLYRFERDCTSRMRDRFVELRVHD